MIKEPLYKIIAWRTFMFLFWLFVVAYAVTNFVNWIRGVPDGKAHYGERCGPSHHWIYVGTSGDLDLSCEEDR
jgi:hypothetical protein